MKNQAPRSPNQAGNVLFIILLGISLFAALSYAVSLGMRGGGAQLSEDKLKLVATEIINYSTSIREGVASIRINGCNEKQISFESVESGTTYLNNNAPTSKLCHVFHPSGANRKYTAFNPTPVLNQGFHGQFSFPGIGTNCTNATCTDLHYQINFGNSDTALKLCSAINSLLNHTDIPTPIVLTSTATTTPFTGTYIYTGAESATLYKGKTAACYRLGSSGPYVYYHVLLVR